MHNLKAVNETLLKSLASFDADTLLQISRKVRPIFTTILENEKIPVTPPLLALLQSVYVPFCAWLIEKQQNKPLVVGINGAQGSGKTTLSTLLCGIIDQGFNKKTLHLSFDDFYLGKQQRDSLANNIHPLLKTRGVPGTHDIELASSVLNHLLTSDSADCWSPLFDKYTDDRLAPSNCNNIAGHFDFILFEGWCVGTPAEQAAALIDPINQLETEEDPDAVWRNYINHRLDSDYKALFEKIDTLLFLQVPHFNKVGQWRQLQEDKLCITRTKKASNNSPATDIERFIQYFERLTRHSLTTMPERADVVFHLDNKHLVSNVAINTENEQT